MKINVAELLKGCPKGTELDCAMYDNVTLISIDNIEGTIFPIKVRRKDGIHITLTKYGQLANADYAKCVIFPKGKTTWEGFTPPCEFKDGDILTNERGSICIYKGPMYYSQNLADFYCGYRISDHAFILKKFKDKHFGDINGLRLASEIEKQYFFQILSNNGYRWNSETKTLEKLTKPRFKVGDKVIRTATHETHIIEYMTSTGYLFKNEGGIGFTFKDENLYELAPNKFDITTLEPFESRVLVRDDGYSLWQPSVWGLYDKGHRFPYITIGCRYRQCIPYEGNEHLLGKTDDCEEFYKTW